MERISRRFRIHGKVQGVYFRHSTRLQAQRLSLTGYAQNLPDGTVEVLAHGAAGAVEELHRWLHRGPDGARVDRVVDTSSEPAAAGESKDDAPRKFEVL